MKRQNTENITSKRKSKKSKKSTEELKAIAEPEVQQSINSQEIVLEDTEIPEPSNEHVTNLNEQEISLDFEEDESAPIEKKEESEPDYTVLFSKSAEKSERKSKKNNFSDFFMTKSEIIITLAPSLLLKPEDGIYETLNGMLLKFVPQLHGVVLTYSNVEFVSQYGRILYDYPQVQFKTSAEFLIWRPKRGLTLEGMINIQSPGHIGILLYDTFNVTIPKANIPSGLYEWVEFETPGIEQEDTTEQDEEEILDASPENDASKQAEPKATQGNKSYAKTQTITQTGQWVDKLTRKAIGNNGYLEFKVTE
ncbi:hypothetical protein BB560_000494 [Smittium megazygosporum]|uniref:RPA43 OB domain-containing protein n=1 Tax=Smittium megazygosporum TaxID=133381 RepID=A0A2T9ZK83_9FUNG|nr:hypothetical protein BB560_000494 [Smittium megazygosporum]